MRGSSGLSHSGASPEGTAIRAMELWSRLHTEECLPGKSSSSEGKQNSLQWREKASTMLRGFLYCHI